MNDTTPVATWTPGDDLHMSVYQASRNSIQPVWIEVINGTGTERAFFTLSLAEMGSLIDMLQGARDKLLAAQLDADETCTCPYERDGAGRLVCRCTD